MVKYLSGLDYSGLFSDINVILAPLLNSAEFVKENREPFDASSPVVVTRDFGEEIVVNISIRDKADHLANMIRILGGHDDARTSECQ
jgi:hypothetical protein